MLSVVFTFSFTGFRYYDKTGLAVLTATIILVQRGPIISARNSHSEFTTRQDGVQTNQQTVFQVVAAV